MVQMMKENEESQNVWWNISYGKKNYVGEWEIESELN